MSTSFTPPPVTSYQGQDPQFTPPPLTSYEGQEEAPTPKAPSWFEQTVHSAANALANFGHDMNPVNIAGAIGAFVDPATAKNAWLNLGAAQDEMRVKAVDSFRKGDYLTGVRQTAAWLWPVMGPTAESISEQGAKGDYSGAIGRAAAFGAQTYLGGKAPAILEGAPGVISASVPVIKGAIKEGIAARGSVIGTGVAEGVGQAIGLPHGAGAAIYNAPQVITGMVRGARAAMPEGLRLEGISQALTGKSYADLAPAEQTAVRSFRNADHATAVNDIAQNLGGKDYLKLSPEEQVAVRGFRTADEAAAVNQFAQSLGGKDFLKLSPEQQAGIRTMYQRSQAYQEAQAAKTAAPVGPMPEFGEAPSAVPGKSLTQLIDEDLATKRAAQTQKLLGVERTPAWQNLPDAPAPLGAMVEGPLPRPVLPTRPPQPASVTPEAAPTPAVEPATGSSLSDLVDAMRGIAKRKAGEQPLSEVGRTPPEPAPEPAPAPAPQPAPAQLTTVPAVEETPPSRGESHAAINRYDKTTKMAQHLVDNGQDLPADTEGWVKLSRDTGEKKPHPPSAESQKQIADKYDLLKQGNPIPVLPSEPFAQKLFDLGVTYKDTNAFNMEQWRQMAAEIGEPPPENLKVVGEIRARLEKAETTSGKIDVGDKLADFMKAQSVTPDAGAKWSIRQFDQAAAAAGLRSTTEAIRANALAALRRKYTLKEIQNIRAEAQSAP